MVGIDRIIYWPECFVDKVLLLLCQMEQKSLFDYPF